MNKLLEIIKLFSARQKALFFLLFCITLFVAIVVASGVGAVFPIVSMFVNPDLILDSTWGQWLYKLVGAKGNSDFTIKLLVGYCTIFIAMQLSFIALSFFQNWFIQNLLLDFRTRMLNGYIAKNYSFFLESNSAVLLKNLLNETNLFVTSLTLSLLQMMTNTMTLLVIGSAVVYMNPKVALAASLIGGAVFGLLYFILQKRTEFWGQERDRYFSEISKMAHLILSGMNLIKTYRCEAPFVNSFIHQSRGFATTTIKYHTVSASIPYFFNLLVYGSAFIGIFIAQRHQYNIIDIIPSLVFYGVGFSKIFPSAIGLFNNVINTRYYWVSLENVHQALTVSESSGHMAQTSSRHTTALPPMQALNFANVNYKYPNADNEALKEVSLDIVRGKRIAFVGQSGAGKSTAINLLLGLIENQSGEISIDGIPLDSTTTSSWRDQIGYVPQEVFLIDSSLKANIALSLDSKDVDNARLEYAIKAARLSTLVDKLPEGVDELVGERGVKLSGGEKQRVGIARALYRQPNILIMDEPTSALDPITEKQIIDDVLAGTDDITILIVTHRLQSVKPCDILYFFEDGEVKNRGTYAELLQDNPAFKHMDEAWK